MIDIVSIGASLITGFCTGLVAHRLATKRNRENDLSKFRLQVYSDFIGSASMIAASRRIGSTDDNLEDLSKMNDAKNRIILSGDKAVIESILLFWKRGGTLEKESELLAFRDLITVMRESLGHDRRDLLGVELTDTMFQLEPSSYSYRAEKESNTDSFIGSK